MGAIPNDDSVYYFVGIDEARFKRPVGPGDQVVFKVEILSNRRGIWKYGAVAEVDGKRVAEASLMATLRDK
jgi:3-hydroxyacyl-[acyl-carrier-protein] dehydratase